jgi:7,8-dihydropterin-6-yl-methyl-4-(beta-D-ribofuranosyl)aminobenzene 5'-phosphate synthase
MKVLATVLIAAGILSVTIAAPARAAEPESKSQITILYDAFGTDPSMTKDWGFSALVEVAGKRILFDTGNDADIFAANVKAKGVPCDQHL